MRRGGVGNALGRSFEAALSKGSDGSRDMGARDGECEPSGEPEPVGDGGEVIGWDWRPRRWMASLETTAFSRM